MLYFTLHCLFLNTELRLQKCVPIKGDMMYFLPCSETHSSPWSKKKIALTLSPPFLPLPFAPSALHPHCSCSLSWVIYDTPVVQPSGRNCKSSLLSLLSTKQPFTKDQTQPSHLLLHIRRRQGWTETWSTFRGKKKGQGEEKGSVDGVHNAVMPQGESVEIWKQRKVIII